MEIGLLPPVDFITFATISGFIACVTLPSISDIMSPTSTFSPRNNFKGYIRKTNKKIIEFITRSHVNLYNRTLWSSPATEYCFTCETITCPLTTAIIKPRSVTGTNSNVLNGGSSQVRSKKALLPRVKSNLYR